MTTLLQHNIRNHTRKISKCISSIFAATFLLFAITNCSDVKSHKSTDFEAFSLADEKQQVKVVSQNLTKMSIDTLSLSRHLINVANSPEEYFKNFSNKCMRFDIQNISKEKRIVEIQWFNRGCKMGRSKKLFY
ncbi:MAG: hypothetical protein KDD40_11445, partial [Bdellovibrionales bacterium]|nr:hypothetical protein [Bdellovibrionales bacterium]